MLVGLGVRNLGLDGPPCSPSTFEDSSSPVDVLVVALVVGLTLPTRTGG